MGTSWTGLGQELPEGWAIARDRPHGLVEAVRRLSPTAIHVLVARDWAELLDKIRATSSGAPCGGGDCEPDSAAGHGGCPPGG